MVPRAAKRPRASACATEGSLPLVAEVAAGCLLGGRPLHWRIHNVGGVGRTKPHHRCKTQQEDVMYCVHRGLRGRAANVAPG